jgi:hypothetical protein
MSQIVVDAMLHEKLPSLTEPVELVDCNGRRLGQYYPDKAVDIYSEPTEEELARLARLAREPGPRYSTAEVLAHLEKLARESPS